MNISIYGNNTYEYSFFHYIHIDKNRRTKIDTIHNGSRFVLCAWRTPSTIWLYDNHPQMCTNYMFNRVHLDAYKWNAEAVIWLSQRYIYIQTIEKYEICFFNMYFNFRTTYAHNILLGLIFSCIGDALLNHGHFSGGMAVFGIAQIFYIMAFHSHTIKFWIAGFLYAGGMFSMFFFQFIIRFSWDIYYI